MDIQILQRSPKEASQAFLIEAGDLRLLGQVWRTKNGRGRGHPTAQGALSVFPSLRARPGTRPLQVARPGRDGYHWSGGGHSLPLDVPNPPKLIKLICRDVTVAMWPHGGGSEPTTDWPPFSPAVRSTPYLQGMRFLRKICSPSGSENRSRSAMGPSAAVFVGF